MGKLTQAIGLSLALSVAPACGEDEPPGPPSFQPPRVRPAQILKEQYPIVYNADGVDVSCLKLLTRTPYNQDFYGCSEMNRFEVKHIPGYVRSSSTAPASKDRETILNSIVDAVACIFRPIEKVTFAPLSENTPRPHALVHVGGQMRIFKIVDDSGKEHQFFTAGVTSEGFNRFDIYLGHELPPEIERPYSPRELAVTKAHEILHAFNLQHPTEAGPPTILTAVETGSIDLNRTQAEDLAHVVNQPDDEALISALDETEIRCKAFFDALPSTL